MIAFIQWPRPKIKNDSRPLESIFAEHERHQMNDSRPIDYILKDNGPVYRAHSFTAYKRR